MYTRNQTLKNIFSLGVVLLIMSVAWTSAEIIKSSKLIELAQDPQGSIERGIYDAKHAFNDGYAHFKSIQVDGFSSEYPGVLRGEIEGMYKDYVLNFGSWCGTDLGLESVALNLGSYEYNEFYVLAYNLELLKLLNGKENT